jgi:acetyl esterase
MPDDPDPFAIDPSLADLAADPRSTARRPPPHVTMAMVREAAARAMLRQPPGPDLFRVWEEGVPAPGGCVRVRLYQPRPDAPAAGILFAHGGGFALGDLDTHDAQCRGLAVHSGLLVAAVEYRLAPEHPYPAGLDDCHAAWTWLVDHSARLGLTNARWALAGDSAGANLAIGLALRLRGAPHAPAALALVYPFLHPGCDTGSALRLAEGPGLSRDAMLWFWENYLGPERQGPETEILRQDLRGLPATSIALAGADPLLDEGLRLADLLERAGVSTTCRVYAGMVHGFLHLRALTPRADEALHDLASDLSEALAGKPDIRNENKERPA